MKPREVIERENEWRAKLEKAVKWSNPFARLTNESGIYIFKRKDETGLRFAYVGQAKHLCDRLLQHCMEYKQRLEISIKKRGFLYEGNPYGWEINILPYSEDRLNYEERRMMVFVGNDGYQLYNKTGGGQDAGKMQINEYKPARGYRDGLAQGYKNAKKEIAPLFEKYIDAVKRGENRADLEEKALAKFREFIKK